jgi:excisionase family DNA binding protein
VRPTGSAIVPDPVTEPYIRVERAAAILTLGLRTTYAAIERGDIPSIRVGRSVRIPTARFLAAFGLSPMGSEAGLSAAPAPRASQVDGEVA